jgi:hypothetical protein
VAGDGVGGVEIGDGEGVRGVGGGFLYMVVHKLIPIAACLLAYGEGPPRDGWNLRVAVQQCLLARIASIAPGGNWYNTEKKGKTSPPD